MSFYSSTGLEAESAAGTTAGAAGGALLGGGLLQEGGMSAPAAMPTIQEGGSRCSSITNSITNSITPARTAQELTSVGEALSRADLVTRADIAPLHESMRRLEYTVDTKMEEMTSMIAALTALVTQVLAKEPAGPK
jgi:hypothetical protein